MTTTINSNDLAHFTGSENRYFHPFFRAFNYTDGVQYVGANGASWLVTDILAVLCTKRKVAVESFVCITFTCKDGKGVIVWDDGNGKVLHRQKVDFTDFPLPSIKFFATDRMLMLASEY